MANLVWCSVCEAMVEMEQPYTGQVTCGHTCGEDDDFLYPFDKELNFEDE